MKIFTKIFALFFIIAVVVSSSCKRSNNSKYFYDAKKDTSAPVINISVPIVNDTPYHYGEDIHIVGTVTDLQVSGFGGKLQSLKIQVDELTNLDSIFIKTLLLKTPDVDAKEGYTFNEKMLIFSGANPTFCRLEVSASDYSSKTTRDTVYFKIQ